MAPDSPSFSVAGCLGTFSSLGASEHACLRPGARSSFLPFCSCRCSPSILGYGGGYYDRTIAGFRTAGLHLRAIGVAFARQEMERVPVEEFDQRLDGVATEDGLRLFGDRP
jgi:hypothetical protein